jgi:hypothetical protein
MIFLLHHSVSLLNFTVEDIRLPVFMCVGGVGLKTRPRFFFEHLTSWVVGYNEHIYLYGISIQPTQSTSPLTFHAREKRAKARSHQISPKVGEVKQSMRYRIDC